MRDQADKLRQIIDNIKIKQKASQQGFMKNVEAKTAKVITVTSGKGGVGKTNITINLAIQLSKRGQRVIILDGDFGLANIDVLFGIIPKYSLVDIIYNRKNILEVLTDGPNNIKFISGGSGVEELVRLNSIQLERFVQNIALLDKLYDVILIDTGAGLSDSVMSFVMAADEVILVTTPEPTSITDAYALIKMVSNREKEKVIKVIINKADSVDEASDIFNKLALVTEKFLTLKLQDLGYILSDEAVVKAVKLQEPFCLSFPKSHATKLIGEISEKIVQNNLNTGIEKNSGVKGFVNRLVRFFNT